MIADAFGIPAVYTMLAPLVGGGDFKFRDYESVVHPSFSRCTVLDGSEDLQELRSRVTPASSRDVDDAVGSLEASIKRLREETPKKVASPLSAWAYQHER